MANPPIWPVQPLFNASSLPLSANPGTLPNMADTIMNLFQLLTFKQITKTVDATFQVIETATSLQFQGVVQPFTAQQLRMKSEGQRLWKWSTIHALPVLSLKPDDVLIDQAGVQYRVMGKKDYSAYGYQEYEIIEDYPGLSPEA